MEFGLILLACAVVLAAAVLALVLRRPAGAPDTRLDRVIEAQGNITGQFQQTVAAQRMLSERLDALSKQLGTSLKENTDKTAETLAGIQARLTVIDEAQKNIAALSGQVVSLQEILSDKQTRGAFGQERMEAIVADQLTPEHYDFQYTLSNGKRPDCIIRLSKDTDLIVIDSKFPLEAFEALRTAATEEARSAALVRMRTDVQKHVKDIADKYVIRGETQTPIIMFIPSESVFSELHFGFPEIMKKARESDVAILSPHLLWLAVSTMRTVLKDVAMRESAHLIKKEVGALLEDVRRLGDRVGNLRGHFDAANKDIGLMETSMRGVERHAERIANVSLDDPDATALPKP